MIGALALGGVAVGTNSASAPVRNFGCRSDNTGGVFADEGHGVHIDSCAENQWGGTGNGVYARIAHDHDHDCTGQRYGGGTDDAIWIIDGGNNWNPSGGAYVVRVGFRAAIDGHLATIATTATTATWSRRSPRCSETRTS